MKLWIKAIRNSMMLYAIALAVIVALSFPHFLGFHSWKEFIFGWYGIAFHKELKRNIHIKQTKYEWREYDWSSSGYVAKYAIKLDNGLKMFIIDTGMNSMKSDWQIISIGDTVLYKGVVSFFERDKSSDGTCDESVTVSSVSISDIHHFLPSVNCLSDIINSSEEVYAWVKKLPNEVRPFKFFSSFPETSPHWGELFKEKFWDGEPLASMRSDFAYSTNDKHQIRQERYYKYGKPFCDDLKRIKYATYSFYRMNLEDHHVSETEDVTAIIPDYYDW